MLPRHRFHIPTSIPDDLADLDLVARNLAWSWNTDIAAVFDHVLVVLGPAAAAGGRGNSVIVASDAPLPRDELARLAARDDGRPVDDLEAFVDGAAELTDDFAPVDQLITGGA